MRPGCRSRWWGVGHGIAPNQLFRWRRLYAEGALAAVGAGEEVMPASEYRALQNQVRERLAPNGASLGTVLTVRASQLVQSRYRSASATARSSKR